MAECPIYDELTFLAFDTNFETVDENADLLDSASLVVKGQARLTNVFAEKPLVKALLNVFIKPLVDIDKKACQLLNNRWIESAVGKQLDGCGYIVGELRQGREDEEYREAILFKVFINTSNSTPEDLMSALRFLTKGEDIQYLESYPTFASLYTNGHLTRSDLASVMQGLAPAGICDLPIFVDYARREPFRLSQSSIPDELFVNNDVDYLTIEGSDWQLSDGGQGDTGARLGGLSADDFFVENDEFYLELDGGIFAINGYESVAIDSGYHLTGLYQLES